MHWAEAGVHTERTPVVLLHGLADSHLTWRPVLGRLAADRRVLLPDLAGSGLSERPDASYTLAWHTHLIASWLRDQELDSVDIVGHSYGGGIGQMLLLERPLRIRRLCLAAAGGLGRELNFWLRLAAFPYFVERFGQPFMAFGTRRARGARARGVQSRADVERLAQMNALPGSARAFSRTVRDVISFGGQERMTWDRMDEIDTFPPMAVLWGEQDAHIPIAHGRRAAERLDGVRFRAFPECTHYLHHDDPGRFVDEVRAFLDNPNPAPVSRAEP